MALNIQPFQFQYQPIQARTPPPSAPVWGPPDMSKQLQEGIAGILPSLASSYHNVNKQFQNEAAGREWLAEAQQARGLGQPGGPYAQPAAPAAPGQPPGPYNPAGKLPSFAGGDQGTKTMPAAPEVTASVQKYAAQYGLDPKDVLTAMSYETGGTFDPWQKGPTTKWGEHRGLIQMGEPQRAQYGVTKDSTVDQQVEATFRYLKDRGVQPGMGLMDIYSAINAGGVGTKYQGRSDAAAGGAPGTVADKVNNQMAGHMRRAEGLLRTAGGGVPPDADWRRPTGPVQPAPNTVPPGVFWATPEAERAHAAQQPAGAVPPAGQPTQQQLDNWRAIVANPRSPPPMLEDAKANLAKYAPGTAAAPVGQPQAVASAAPGVVPQTPPAQSQVAGGQQQAPLFSPAVTDATRRFDVGGPAGQPGAQVASLGPTPIGQTSARDSAAAAIEGARQILADPAASPEAKRQAAEVLRNPAVAPGIGQAGPAVPPAAPPAVPAAPPAGPPAAAPPPAVVPPQNGPGPVALPNAPPSLVGAPPPQMGGQPLPAAAPPPPAAAPPPPPAATPAPPAAPPPLPVAPRINVPGTGQAAPVGGMTPGQMRAIGHAMMANDPQMAQVATQAAVAAAKAPTADWDVISDGKGGFVRYNKRTGEMQGIGQQAGPKIITLEQNDPRRATYGVPAGEARPVQLNTETGQWTPVDAPTTPAGPKVEKIGGVDHIWNPKTGKYEPYVDPQTGKPPEQPMFPDTSVEGRALNHMVTRGILTKDQAADLATGKTVTSSDGRTLFFTGTQLLGQDPATGQWAPLTGPTERTPPAAPGAAPAGPAAAPAAPGAAPAGPAAAPAAPATPAAPAAPAATPRGPTVLTPAKPAPPLSGEAAGRYALGQGYIETYAPKVRELIDSGKLTTPVGRGKLFAKVGEQGELYRRIDEGSEGLVRMLTGAGMPETEAKRYRERYLPSPLDSKETMLSKVDQLERAIKRVNATVSIGHTLTSDELDQLRKDDQAWLERTYGPAKTSPGGNTFHRTGD